MSTLGLILGTFARAATGAGAALVQHRQRHQVRNVARRFRLSYTSQDALDVQERFQNLRLMRRGHDRHACSLIHGLVSEGFLCAFRYQYDLGLGGDRTTHTYWYIVIEGRDGGPGWHTTPARDQDESIIVGVSNCNLSARHERVRRVLPEPELAALLDTLPRGCHVEIEGELLGIACPARAAVDELDRLMEKARGLAGWWHRASPAPGREGK
jgi:hypothetical protein